MSHHSCTKNVCDVRHAHRFLECRTHRWHRRCRHRHAGLSSAAAPWLVTHGRGAASHPPLVPHGALPPLQQPEGNHQLHVAMTRGMDPCRTQSMKNSQSRPSSLSLHARISGWCPVDIILMKTIHQSPLACMFGVLCHTESAEMQCHQESLGRNCLDWDSPLLSRLD